LKEFDPQPVFDPSLFVEIRKRGGHEAFDSLTFDLINSSAKRRTRNLIKKMMMIWILQTKVKCRLMQMWTIKILHIQRIMDF